MLLVVKSLLLSSLLLFSGALFAKDIYILVLGQTVAGNCNEQRYDVYPGVYQYDKQGNEVAAKDPFIWSDCEGGSIWMPLGKELIDHQLADRVIFMPIGVQSQIMDWLPEGVAWQRLNEALNLAQEKDIHFDYVLWHQDSLDLDMNKFDYQNVVNKTIKYVSSRVGVKKWLVAQHLRCRDDQSDSVAMTKGSFSEISFNRYLGPNTKALQKEFRVDNCRLNAKGQEELALRWFNAIVQAERKFEKIKSESLLKFFQRSSHTE